MPRSLRVQELHLPQIKTCLLRNGFPSQKLLAEALSISQSTVSNFLNGRPVDYVNFLEICRILGQEWRNLADLGEPWEETAPPSQQYKILIRDPAISGLSKNLSSFLPQFRQSLSQNGLGQIKHEILVADAQTPPKQYLSDCNYWLLLLSPTPGLSEILLEDLQYALELQQLPPHKPAILPIWLHPRDSYLPVPQPQTIPWDVLQALQGTPLWQWNCDRTVSDLTSELLTLLQNGFTSLPLDHPFAISWRSLYPTLQPPPPNSPIPTSHHPQTPTLEIPEGQVILDSPLYLPRPPIEALCFETILQPGSLIRIKAPRQMGKTSLLTRVLQQAAQQGSRVIHLNLQLANKRIFASADTFLQWFCASLGLELGQLDQLASCWQLADIIGSNQSCRVYLEQHLLADPAPPLTLGIDELDRVFEFPEIAEDFLGLLRSLHEEAKRRPIWQKLRLVIVHSTEVYLPLDVNKSPFNVGLPIELPEFTPEQIQTLAQRHGLAWEMTQVEQLVALVGGHPYLVRLSLYHIARGTTTLSELLQASGSNTSIYGEHLRRHWWNLEKYPELVSAIQTVVSCDRPTRLGTEVAFRLQAMGLIRFEHKDCRIRCQLYEQYLRDRLLEEP